MRKILVICGPTATGKTSLALKLAKKFSGEIISADSRQVYKYMDIGTGKDRPKNIQIKGYDLVSPDSEFSISHYIDFANKAIDESFALGKLPILVGGTGFYISGAIDGVDTATTPRNLKLRNKLGKLSVEDLKDRLKEVDFKKYKSMNQSDVNNPRRLVRAIELSGTTQNTKPASHKLDSLFIGLSLPKEELERRIAKRVEARLKQGFEKEYDFLSRKKLLSFAPSATLGYKQWILYKDGKISRAQAIDQWKREEIKFAKRQMTWFKKDPRINWFDASDENLAEKIEIMVNKWYS